MKTAAVAPLKGEDRVVEITFYIAGGSMADNRLSRLTKSMQKKGMAAVAVNASPISGPSEGMSEVIGIPIFA